MLYRTARKQSQKHSDQGKVLNVLHNTGETTTHTFEPGKHWGNNHTNIRARENTGETTTQTFKPGKHGGNNHTNIPAKEKSSILYRIEPHLTDHAKKQDAASSKYKRTK